MTQGLLPTGSREEPIEDPYRDDLAFIHDAGYGGIASDAAGRLLEELARTGCHEGTVVDLGCGSGILADHLVEAGYRAVGIDLSEAMVALARARAPKANFQVASFVSADLPECVAVTAIGEVLNYGFDAANTTRAREGLFRRVYDALVPGGLLMFDVAGPERATLGDPQRTFAEGPDWAVLVETRLDAVVGVLTRKITSFRQVQGLYRRDTEVHRLALLDPDALLSSLRAVGFHVQVIPGYGRTALPRGLTVFLCSKPARFPPTGALMFKPVRVSSAATGVVRAALRDKANGNEVATGGWTVTRK